MGESPRNYRIDVLARALAVLDHLGDQEEPAALSDISASLELDKSRVFRILETLREAGYVDRDEEQKTYTLGVRILDLKTAAMRSMDLPARAMPHIQALASALQDSVSIGVLDGVYVRYVARATFRRIIGTNIEVGTKLPAHVSSMGKLLLAQLPDDEVRALYDQDGRLYPMTRHTITGTDDFIAHLHEIRDQGYAVADEELELGLWGAAIPLKNAHGGLVAALSVSVPKAREPSLQEILPHLRECATAIARDL